MTSNGFDNAVTELDPQRRIEEAACQWWAVNQSDQCTEAERTAFEAWLAADERHAEIYASLETVWADLGRFTDLEVSKPQPREKSWMTGRGLALAASVALAVVITAIAAFSWFGASSGPVLANASLSTVQGVIREEALADGSSVTLGAESWMTVEYTATERRVSLKAGEAFFSVSKEDPRPFIVTAGDTTVRVLGTKFDVRLSPNQVRVGVLEGIVEVAQTGNTAQGHAYVTLPAGQRIVTTRGHALAEAQAVVFAEPGAWRDGRLIYENAPLSQVLADANRYFDGRFVVESDALNNLSVSASFRTENSEHLLAALNSGLPISTERLANGNVIVRALSEE